MLAIAARLNERGFDTVVSLAEPYAGLAAAAGVTPYVGVSRQRFGELLGEAAVWRPFRGAKRLLGWAAEEWTREQLRCIQKFHRPNRTILVSHPLDFGSRLFRQADPSTPLVDVHLAPAMLRTLDDPPRMTSLGWELRRPRWAMALAYRCLDRCWVDPAVRPALARQQSTWFPDDDTQPVPRRVMDRWWLSPDRVLAMYPRWYAPACERWVPQLRYAGFPLSDGPDQRSDDAAILLTRMWRWIRENRPCVWTSGTAHHHAATMFRRVIETGNRATLLLSSHGENLPREVPAWCRTADYLPLSKLLPHCSGIVHHGGIGTTSAAMKTGCPQAVMPMAFDQFDNAQRATRLRVGFQIEASAFDAAEVAERLQGSRQREACLRLAKRMASEPDASTRAADEVQSVYSDFHD